MWSCSHVPCAAIWGVENKVHWIMDVRFHEDQSRARAGFAAENLTTLRRFALNLLRKEKTKKAGHQGKTAQRRLESRLFAQFIGNLDASALVPGALALASDLNLS
jgi:hypothetical protein